MKKTIAMLTVAILLFAIMAVPAMAHSANASYGDVPKSKDAITLDGDKDAIYDQGLKLELSRQVEAYADPETPTRGTVTLLWQDGFIFIFAEVKDAYLVPQANYADQAGQPWMTDSLESFFDWDNNMEGSESDQFRLDAYGWRSFEFRATTGESSYGLEENVADGKFEGKVKIVDGGYNAEFKIPIQNGKGAGDGIGYLAQINDMQDDDATRCMVFTSSSNGESKSWEPINYDYIVLSANEVTAVVEEVVVPEEPAVEADVPAVVDTPAANTAPKTGDASIAIFAVLIIAAAGVVVFRKQTAK